MQLLKERGRSGRSSAHDPMAKSMKADIAKMKAKQVRADFMMIHSAI